MKLRIRFRDKREVVQLPDISTNGYSVRQLTQIVEDTFNLERYFHFFGFAFADLNKTSANQIYTDRIACDKIHNRNNGDEHVILYALVVSCCSKLEYREHKYV